MTLPFVRPLIAASALFAVTFALAACGGGGGSAAPPATLPAASNGPTSPAGVLHGILSMTFGGTTGASTLRRPLFLSPSAKSVSVAVTGVAQNVVADISATSALCTSTGTTQRTCAIPVSAPQGNITFTVTVYDAANATGNVLGTGSVTQAISGATFAASIGVQGNVARVRVLATQTQFTSGTAGTATLSVTALDAGGNVITGTYASPITLVNSDTSGTFTLSTNVVTSSTQTLTLAYNGGATPAQATISATAPNVPSASVSTQTLYVGVPALNYVLSPLPAGDAPNQVVNGPDGNVWLADPAARASVQALRVAVPGYAIAAFPVSNGDPVTGGGGYGTGIVNGGDGNLYISNGVCTVYRVTPAGNASVLSSVPSCQSGPGGPGFMTLGPDRAIWAVLYSNAALGVARFPTSGATPTVYTVSTSTAQNPQRYASHIVTGPDGALWMTDFGSSTIYRITTSGAITSFTTPTANSSPEGITVGPDGALWFAENGPAKIGRLTTAGQFSEYPLPSGVTYPRGLAVARTGELFFIAASTVGKINTLGAITVYALGPNASFTDDDLIASPDGSMLYTAVATSTIGSPPPFAFMAITP